MPNLNNQVSMDLHKYTYNTTLYYSPVTYELLTGVFKYTLKKRKSNFFGESLIINTISGLSSTLFTSDTPLFDYQYELSNVIQIASDGELFFSAYSLVNSEDDYQKYSDSITSFTTKSLIADIYLALGYAIEQKNNNQFLALIDGLSDFNVCDALKALITYLYTGIPADYFGKPIADPFTQEHIRSNLRNLADLFSITNIKNREFAKGKAILDEVFETMKNYK